MTRVLSEPPDAARKLARRGLREAEMVFGEVGEALELLGVFVTIIGSLAVMVVLGRWWQA